MDSRTEITGEKMDELRRLAEAATPGPWAAEFQELGSCIAANDVSIATAFGTAAITGKPLPHEENAAYIAAFSPDVILALLDRASSPARSAEGMVTVKPLTYPAEYDVLPHMEEIRDKLDDANDVHLLGSAMLEIMELRKLLSAQPGTEAEAGEPVAWRCYDKVMGTWSVTDSAELVNSRARRPQDWIVEPLYDAPPSLASRVQELEKALRDLERFWRGRVWQGVTAQDQEDIDAAFAALNTGTKP